MIVYVDSSALVKRYIREAGSSEVNSLIAGAESVGTGLISRVEVSAALVKAVRARLIPSIVAETALITFRTEWPQMIRLQITDTLIERADSLAWSQGLRGYDAVHLASAISWQDTLGRSVRLVTFDEDLRDAGERWGMQVWPEDPEAFGA